MCVCVCARACACVCVCVCVCVCPPRDTTSVLLQRQFSPPAEKRWLGSPTAQRKQPITARRPQEGRGREREPNKENMAAQQQRDVDIFMLPAPPTPASSKKSTRGPRTGLTTPTHKGKGARTDPLTPHGEGGVTHSHTQHPPAAAPERTPCAGRVITFQGRE